MEIISDLQWSPVSPEEIHEARGDTYKANEDFEKARADYQTAIQLVESRPLNKSLSASTREFLVRYAERKVHMLQQKLQQLPLPRAKR